MEEKHDVFMIDAEQMTIRDRAIVSAHSGIMVGQFADMHGYIEEIEGRPVQTFELGLDDELIERIKQGSAQDYADVCAKFNVPESMSPEKFALAMVDADMQPPREKVNVESSVADYSPEASMDFA